MLTRLDLHPYQAEAERLVLEKRGGALLMEMGLGKTVVVLSAIEQMLKRYKKFRTLVVAPKYVALHTWPTELTKWEHTEHLTHRVAAGVSQRERVQAVEASSDILLINYENLIWLLNYLDNKPWPFKMVVFDELTKMKNPSAKRLQAFIERRAEVAAVVGLTGTPVPNGMIDFWAQMACVDGGNRLGANFTAFSQRWFAKDEHGYRWYPRRGAVEEIKNRCKDICLTLKTRDYLDLPPVVKNYIPVEIPYDARRAYDQMENELFLDMGELVLDELTNDYDTVTAGNAAAKHGKCHQIANGAVYLDREVDGDGKPIGPQRFKQLHSAKLEALDSVIEEAAGAPVLVGYTFKSDLARLRDHFAKSKLRCMEMRDASNTIDMWNRGDIDVLFVHPDSAGHGINLQYAGHILVWFSNTWNLESYLQLNGRIDRQGQEHTVFVHHLVATDTVDEVIRDAQQDKGDVQDLFMAYMKRRHA